LAFKAQHGATAKHPAVAPFFYCTRRRKRICGSAAILYKKPGVPPGFLKAKSASRAHQASCPVLKAKSASRAIFIPTGSKAHFAGSVLQSIAKPLRHNRSTTPRVIPWMVNTTMFTGIGNTFTGIGNLQQIM
jgi:hypothetical protein